MLLTKYNDVIKQFYNRKLTKTGDQSMRQDKSYVVIWDVKTKPI